MIGWHHRTNGIWQKVSSPASFHTSISQCFSTLALTFFRFVEPTSGTIEADGVDISKVGLTDLRSKLTIIPRARIISFAWHRLMFASGTEDPTILSGTLRSTLDVFNEYEDAEIVSSVTARWSPSYCILSVRSSASCSFDTFRL